MVERTVIARNGREYVALNGLTRHDPGYEYLRAKSYEERHPGSRRAKDQRRLARARQVILEAKQKSCEDCQQHFPHYVLEFHHRDPSTKLFSLSKVMTGSKDYPISVIKAEIAKCDLLCANCHRIRTHQRRLKAA